MRQLLALLAAALLGSTAVACGGASKATSSTSPVYHAGTTNGDAATVPSSAAPSGSYLRDDGDTDFDDVKHYRHNATDDNGILFATYGGKASPADARAVTTLLRSYYAAAAAGDGATSCSLLDPRLASELATEQSQSAQGARNTCAGAMSLLLKQQHQQLTADDVATMTVIAVHVKGNLGLAVLGFRTMPEGEIVVERKGNAWKIDALIDGEMP